MIDFKIRKINNKFIDVTVAIDKTIIELGFCDRHEITTLINDLEETSENLRDKIEELQR